MSEWWSAALEEVNNSCVDGMCFSLEALGPPPDLILTLPPPPLPSFLSNSAPVLANASCSLCRWAQEKEVGYIEMPREDLAIDDTWFFVIVSVCVGLTAIAIFAAVICLRLRETRKPRLGSTPSKTKSVLGDAVLYPTSASANSGGGGGAAARVSRALWAGLRTNRNHYTVEHAQPVDQKNNCITSSTTDSSDGGYADISPPRYRNAMEKVHILPERAAQREAAMLRESYPLHAVVDGYDHCYEEPVIGTERHLYADQRPLYEEDLFTDIPVHIYEKPQYRTTGRSPRSRPKNLHGLTRSSPRSQRLAPSISNPRTVNHQLKMAPLNQRNHRTLDFPNMMDFCPSDHHHPSTSAYSSPVV